MEIKGFIETSMLDWDGKISSVVFTPGCNFKCPFCHNKDLVLDPEEFDDINEKDILAFIDERSDFIDGVCITGGEPTLHADLPEFCKTLKEHRLLVKLDTNGTNPEMLKNLLGAGLLDFVSMDIKAPLEQGKYDKAAGAAVDLERIKESIQLLINSTIDYEFRTTIVPSIHTKKDVEEITKHIAGAKRYVLQKFQPTNCLNEELNKLKSQSDEEMEELASIAKNHVENTKWRGR